MELLLLLLLQPERVEKQCKNSDHRICESYIQFVHIFWDQEAKGIVSALQGWRKMHWSGWLKGQIRFKLHSVGLQPTIDSRILTVVEVANLKLRQSGGFNSTTLHRAASLFSVAVTLNTVSTTENCNCSLVKHTVDICNVRIQTLELDYHRPHVLFLQHCTSSLKQYLASCL